MIGHRARTICILNGVIIRIKAMVNKMKRIVFLILLFFLLLCGCVAPQKEATTSQTLPAEETMISTNATSPGSHPLWHYDLKVDGVYRANQNTGEVIKIGDSDDTAIVIISENWVYYKDNGLLYRMDNENNKELISSEECWQLQLSGDKLYYKNSSGLNRMNLDGSGKELIFQCEFVNMVIADQYIFYILDVPINDEDYHEDGPPLSSGELHRVDLNGENDVNLRILIRDLCVYKNNVYFLDPIDNCFYSMNPKSLDKEIVYTGYWFEDPYFSGDYVFFGSDHVFYKLSLTEGTIKPLAEAWDIQCYGILDGYVYINIDGGGDDGKTGLYRIPIDGVNLEKVE